MTSFLKYLRKARIIIALLVFVLISAQFLDIYNQLPKPYYMYYPVNTQFMPSLIKWAGTGAVVASAAFITFSLFALVCGRVYCASFCAFGILMDVIRRSTGIIGNSKFFKNTRFGKFVKKSLTMKNRPARNGVRVVFLTLAIVLILGGWTTLLGFLDPYSLYGKIMGSVVHPIVALTTNATSAELYKFDIYLISPINGDPRIALSLFGIALAILLVISVATILRGRIFCNTLCPVGAYLGLISKFSLIALSLDKSKCISCGMCERNCKSECIDSKNKNLDFSKCVLCLNCANACKKSAVKFSLNKKYKILSSKKTCNANSNCHTEKKHSASMTRRAFPSALGVFSALLLSGAKKDCNGQQKRLRGQGQHCQHSRDEISPFEVDGKRPDKRLTAPPGAGSIENFLEKCTACQICTAACKAQILKPSIGEWGLSHFMQPYMDFDEGFCLHNCHNCSKACPTGAINFISGKEKRQLKIGTAIFDEDLCIVKTDGNDCAACGEHCPVQAIEMLPFGDPKDSLYIPFVHSEVCIGCGACESICPVRPHRAIVVQGLAVHRQAKKFEESMRIHKTTKKIPTSDKIAPQENPFPF